MFWQACAQVFVIIILTINDDSESTKYTNNCT